MTRRHGGVASVVVVGAGLAGLSAAVRLSQIGYRPVVIEKRSFPGGRAFSFRDSETGVEVDNGQHVFVGACTEYSRFLKDIGAWDNVKLPERLDAAVIRNGIESRLQGAELPGAIANVPAVLGFGHLSTMGKLRVLRGLAAIKFSKALPGGRLETETFEGWLRRHGQDDETIRCFWNLIGLPALNDDIAAVSAIAGVMLFRTALLSKADSPAIGYPLKGLTSLSGYPAQSFIEKAGGSVSYGTEATCLEILRGRVHGVRVAGGTVVRASAIVVALPAQAMLSILPVELATSQFFGAARGLESAPIVNLHFWFDRPVMNEEFVAVIGSPLQWVFNVSLMRRDTGRGQHLAISLSGAWQWKDRSKTDLKDIFLAELGRHFPRVREATVTRFLTVKMLDATFRMTPGASISRLSQKTPISNLFLAGDWTATGWPSTMEGAVRSGNLAAAAAHSYFTSMQTLQVARTTPARDN